MIIEFPICFVPDINDCINPNACLNGGTCFDKVNAFSCVCVPGYNGSSCESK